MVIITGTKFNCRTLGTFASRMHLCVVYVSQSNERLYPRESRLFVMQIVCFIEVETQYMNVMLIGFKFRRLNLFLYVPLFAVSHNFVFNNTFCSPRHNFHIHLMQSFVTLLNSL